MTDSQLQILEEKLAFLEDTVQLLNDALTNQQQQLNVLQNCYEALRSRYAELSNALPDDQAPIDQKPPHY